MPGSFARIALVTGGNRGIGFEIARQLAEQGISVVIGARDPAKGRAAADALRGDGSDVSAVRLDVTDDVGIGRAIAEIENARGPIDILVNNAGILIDGPGGFDSKLEDMTAETLQRTFETNVGGPAQLIKALMPGMAARGYGRIVNVSSRAGQLAHMEAGFPAYRMSKAALNALTRISAAEAGHANVLVNAMCPGWCRTGMGGDEAERSPAEGAKTAVWLATLDDCRITGSFFHDERKIEW